MSANAIGQNATDLAVSGPGELDLNALVAKVATRKVKPKGLTEASINLDYSTVFSAVCAEYKSFSGIERKARLADEVVNKIDEAIRAFQETKLKRFNEDLVAYRCFAAHKASEARFVRAETIRRESAMDLKEQHLFCGIAITEAQKRVDKLVAKYEDQERIGNAKKALARLEHTMMAIKAMMAGTQ